MASSAACTTARWLLLLAVVAIVVTRIIALGDVRDPDRDMAMLMTNVPLAGMADYFRPLPYYEQTTPLGHLFLIDMLSRLFGPEGMARFLAVRTVSAVAGLAALGLIALSYRRFTRSGELALIRLLSAMSLQMMVFSVSEKPYIYS